MSSAEPTRPVRPPAAAAPISAQTLLIIRFSYFMGALLFGAVTYLRHRTGAPVEAANLGVLARIVPFVQTLMLAGAIGLRTVLTRRSVKHDALPGEDAGLRLAAWALGEAAALTGGVHYFLTGQPHYWIIGMCVLLMTFVIVPLRQADR